MWVKEQKSKYLLIEKDQSLFLEVEYWKLGYVSLLVS